MKRLCIAVSMTALLAGAALGQSAPAPLHVQLDPTTTAIHWTLGATVHTVHGTFRLKSGAIDLNPATGEASGLIVVDATSGESGEQTRDRRMHREVIESAKYPEITFRPSRVHGTVDLAAPGPITVEGVLTLHGQDHPLTVPVQLRRAGGQLMAEAKFDIPYVAWGMKDPSTFILRVEKQVHLTLETAATADR